MTTVQPAQSPTSGFPLDTIWQMVMGQLRLQLSQNICNAYIRDARLVEIQGDTVVVAAHTPEARDWMASRLTGILQRQLSPLIGRPVSVRVVAQGDETSSIAAGNRPESTPAASAHPAPPGLENRMLVQAPLHSQMAKETLTSLEKGGELAPHVPSQAAHVASQEEHVAQAGQAVHVAAAVGFPAPSEPAGEEDSCASVILEAIDDSVESALQQQGKIIAFPRYELRFIPLVGPEAFFLRLAFLQERFFHTNADSRGKPFETSVDALLRWANVGRATLHRFKKGDPARGQLPAAGWFGIEQLPNSPRSADSQRQPPCRYRILQGIPLTPMDADRLYDHLIAAGIRSDPLVALQRVCEQPLQEILSFPPPAPSEAHKKRTPIYMTPAGVVQQAMAGQKIDPDLRQPLQEWVTRLTEHITMPQQMVFVSWYFLQHWLPLLGHDAAALVIYARAQGYYNPQEHELRDIFTVPGGYRELAGVIGLKRDRTIGDWLPNLFDRKDTPGTGAADTEKWQREQQRQQQTQEMVGNFIQVVPGSRWKTVEGHYGFRLEVEIKGEALTPGDRCLRAWVHHTLAACADANVLDHFHAWVTSDAVRLRGRAVLEAENDGRGILGDDPGARAETQNDGWGILAAREAARQQKPPAKMTAGESGYLPDDGWGILEAILNDGRGILAQVEMTAGELFKGLWRLNTYWETILQNLKTTPEPAKTETVVVRGWDLRAICQRNGGMSHFRERIIAGENSAAPFLSWLYYAYSFKGRGIQDPVGWALSKLQGQPGAAAEGAFQRLAGQPPDRIARALRSQIETGIAPHDEDWSAVFRDTPPARLRQLEEVLGLSG